MDSDGFQNTLMEFLLELYIDLLTAGSKIEFSWKFYKQTNQQNLPPQHDHTEPTVIV